MDPMIKNSFFTILIYWPKSWFFSFGSPPHYDEDHVGWSGDRCGKRQKKKQEDSEPPIFFVSEEAKCKPKQEDGHGDEGQGDDDPSPDHVPACDEVASVSIVCEDVRAKQEDVWRKI